MEKNSKNILIATLSGIVACIVCAGVIFLFTNRSDLKGNQYLSGEEINLGDSCSACMNTCLIDESQSYCENECSWACTTTPAASNTAKPLNPPTSTTTTVPTATTTTAPTSTTSTSPTATTTPTSTTTTKPTSTTSTVPTATTTTSPTATTTTAPTSTATTVPTASTCSISHCKTYSSQTATNCKCSKCDSGYSSTDSGVSCKSCEDQCANTGSGYSYCMTQCTGTTVTATPSTSPTSTATSEYHCYCNPINNMCEWRNTNANNWLPMSNIVSQEQCRYYTNNNSRGCFKNSSNTYVWGAYGDTSGYTAVTGVATADVCEALNNGDPDGKIYGLTCPLSVVMVGETIACTYSTSTNATLVGQAGSDNTVASVSHDATHVNVKGLKAGQVSVYGITSDGNRTNSVALIVSDTAVPDTCTVSISTGSVVVSIDSDNNDNSYYTVNVVVSGKDCGGQTITYSATNSKNNPPKAAYTMLAGKTSHTESFKVYPKTACSSSTTTATLTNGKKSSVTVPTIQHDWVKTDGVCEKNPAYTSFETADRDGANVYYTNYGKCSDGTNGYRTVWRRSGCGGGGSTTPTPTPVSEKYDFCCVKDDGTTYSWSQNQASMKCPSGYHVDSSKNKNTCQRVLIPACYMDSEGESHWTANPESSWIIVPNVSNETVCLEKPACYVDSNGDYHWGEYGSTSGYTIVTAMSTETMCHKPTTEEACYKNSDDDYIWTSEAPAGYEKVTDATKPADCEKPACYYYESTQEFKWGKYAGKDGYYYIDDESMNSADTCRMPEGEACYKDPDGKYVWGSHDDEDGYELIPSITDINQCSDEVRVDSTGLDVSKIMYIFMAILMACGIVFIYYSSILKKNN